MSRIVLSLLLLVSASLSANALAMDTPTTREETAAAAVAKSAYRACLTRPATLELQFGRRRVSVELPARGSFVEESHYVTTHDTFSDGRTYPRPMSQQPPGEQAVQCDEGIEAHLERSLALFRQFQPDATLEVLYPRWWQRVWTPREGGQCGQGSIGDEQLELLTPELELWLLTMNWAPGEKPAPGTRFLLSAAGRYLVVIAGFETGPRSAQFLGGVTPEVHAWLGTDNSTGTIELALAADQTLPPGPIDCVLQSTGFGSNETDP